MEEREAYLLPRVAEADFPELLSLMNGEDQFPATFSEWQTLWDRRRREEHDNGRRVLFVEVLPAAFATYCSSRKIPSSWTTLGQFITAKAGR